MGHLILKGKVLERTGNPPFLLPADELPFELLAHLAMSQPGDEIFIGDLAQGWDLADKKRLQAAYQAGRSRSESVWRAYCAHVLKWASILNGDNRWKLTDFEVVYEAQIDSCYCHRVIVTNANVRFAEAPRGLLTFAEFDWHYGINIVNHLEAYKSQRVAEIDEVLRHIQAQLTCREVPVITLEGSVGQTKVTVLESMERDLWRLPQGYKLLDGD